MEGPLLATGDGLLTPKGVCVLLGASLVLVAGIVLLHLQDEAPALLAHAAELERDARAFLDERDALLRRCTDAEALDARRLALIDAGKAMIEACENVLGADDLSLADAVDTVLRAGQSALLNAIDFERNEYWAVSIFQMSGDELNRIAALRPNSIEERLEGRGWRKGEGFAGMAWQHDQEVIIPDCTLPEVADAYQVSPEKRSTLDEMRYRSMAVVPVRVGPCDDFWGVVAVSSDRIGRFRRNPDDYRVKNLETVRLIARTIELLAAGFARGGR